MNPLSITAHSLAETEALGRRLAGHLFPGAVVGLSGPLGAGKTNLTRAIAEGLEVANSSVVTSPTFVLIQEYDGRLPIYHFDAYRLSSEAEFAELGAHEYFAGQGVCVVEWADKVPSCLPKERIEIRITISGDTSRQFEIAAQGARHEAVLDKLVRQTQEAGER